MFVRVIVPLVTDRYQQFCLPEFIVIVHSYEFFFLDFQKYIIFFVAVNWFYFILKISNRQNLNRSICCWVRVDVQWKTIRSFSRETFNQLNRIHTPFFLPVYIASSTLVCGAFSILYTTYIRLTEIKQVVCFLPTKPYIYTENKINTTWSSTAYTERNKRKRRSKRERNNEKKEKYREGDCENVRVKESPRHEIQTIPQAPH